MTVYRMMIEAKGAKPRSLYGKLKETTIKNTQFGWVSPDEATVNVEVTPEQLNDLFRILVEFEGVVNALDIKKGLSNKERAEADRQIEEIALHRTQFNTNTCATCEGGGCYDCTDTA